MKYTAFLSAIGLASGAAAATVQGFDGEDYQLQRTTSIS